MPTFIPPIKRYIIVALLAFASAGAASAQDSPLAFAVTYDAAVTDSYTGRVYVMLSSNTTSQPRFGPSWFNTEPFFAVDVVDWRPNDVLRFDDRDSVFAFPEKISQLTEGEYAIQAVMRRNLDSPQIGRAEGTAYSENEIKTLKPDSNGLITLHIDKVVEPRDRAAHPAVKQLIDDGRLVLVRLRSDLLSAFHGRDIYQEAAVYLPKDYNEDENSLRIYPALYIIGGFGSDEFQALFMGMRGAGDQADNMIKIGLNPLMRSGHHTFADSANNGPVGTAFVNELIPLLEAQFRIAAKPSGRYVTGISSGGWASLWLQITYPDTFGGVWSFSPDPVDFRKFQTVNLYEPGANIYHDEAGQPRPLGRDNGQVMLWAEPFAKMENVMGEGGQLHSFEAVFSPRRSDSKPMPLYDRATGAVDPKVAEAWKKYDIRLVLEQNWQTLGPKLAGKINVITGEDDTFNLEDAVKLLKESLESLGSDARVEVLEGRDHGSAMSTDQLERMHREIVKHFDASIE